VSPDAQRIAVALLFLLFGLPPGLCSMLQTREVLLEARGSSAEALFYAPLFEALWLIGIATFVAMLWLCIRTLRRGPP
jgi:hypothetical protein